MFTIDVSVFLNAILADEASHAESSAFVLHVREAGAPIYEPTLLLPELAGAISRGRSDIALAQRFTAELTRLPNLQLVALDTGLAQQAVEIAAMHRLRGADAVYAAVARRYATVLVTRDREQRDRLAAVVTTRWPEDVLRAESSSFEGSAGRSCTEG